MTTTAFSGPLLWLPEVDSTNSYLKREASGLAHGTCLLAEKQTAGRGRLSRQLRRNMYDLSENSGYFTASAIAS